MTWPKSTACSSAASTPSTSKRPTSLAPIDITDFLFFIHCYCDLLELHHKAEEEFLFPSISSLAGTPDLLAPSTAQHATTTSPDAYSGPSLQSLISSFAPALLAHLADEIDALLALRDLDAATLMRIHCEAEKVKVLLRAEEMFPLFFGLVPAGYEDGIHRFPEVPFFVPWVVRFWFARAHWGAWRFLQCDFWARRRELVVREFRIENMCWWGNQGRG
jgi:hypothetical protein